MKKILFSLVMVTLLALSACASPTGVSPTQPSSSDQAETIAAATTQALQSNAPVTSTPEPPTELLPHSLYFLGEDQQVYRMERDGKTVMQITNDNMTDFDVSPMDGSVAYAANNQLMLVNADGSNRRVLVLGDPTKAEYDPRFFKEPLSNPVFSPDGQTIAYAHKGLNLYDVTTGASKLVITDQRSEMGFPIEIYSPVHYSPDGTKLLVALGHWESAPSHAVYHPDTNALVKYVEVEDYIYCCSFHGGPVWSQDSASFYGVASVHDTGYQMGELWRIDAGTGALTRMLPTDMFRTGIGTAYLPKEIYLAPDGHLYFFFGMFQTNSGYWEPPVLNMVRSSPDGVTDRNVLRDENFRLLNEALWAPDASFAITATWPGANWNREGGVLELYYIDRQKSPVWLAPFGTQMKWGP